VVRSIDIASDAATRACFSMQLITICAVVKLKWQCKLYSCCIVNWLITRFYAAV